MLVLEEASLVKVENVILGENLNQEFKRRTSPVFIEFFIVAQFPLLTFRWRPPASLESANEKKNGLLVPFGPTESWSKNFLTYSCPCLVVPFLEELISRTFLDENQFRLVSQDRVRSQNRIGCLVFVSRTVLSCLTHSPLINAECQEDSIVFLLKRPKWISHR